MTGVHMSVVEIVSVVCSALSAIGALYLTLRKQKRTEDKEEKKEDQEVEETTIAQWRAIVAERKKRHDADVARLEGKISRQEDNITEIRKSERECQLKAAKQEARIEGLEEEVRELKAILKEHGMREDTDSHKPLPPDKSGGP